MDRDHTAAVGVCTWVRDGWLGEAFWHARAGWLWIRRRGGWPCKLAAAGAIIEYLVETQKQSSCSVIIESADSGIASAKRWRLDEATRADLEITHWSRGPGAKRSLLAAIDRTITALGSRALADWLANPLTDLAALAERHDAVGELVADARLTEDLQERLRGIADVERLLARVTTGRASPRDLAAIGRTLATLPAIKARLTARKSALLCRLEQELDLCAEIRAKLETALADDCPLVSREGGFIRDGFHPPLDTLRELASGGKQWIAQYQANEIARTGIPSLKVGFNKVFGYYLEVTHTHGQKVPETYIRKQTVKNAERYITPELKEYEEKVLSADEKAKELEYQLFVELREATAACAPRLQATAAMLGAARRARVASAPARSTCRGYCRPNCVAEPVLKIIDGRHPVLDVLTADGSFVPNDAICGPEEGAILLITGPNMAGKSTYIRQVALITLMAQMGSLCRPARQSNQLAVTDLDFRPSASASATNWPVGTPEARFMVSRWIATEDGPRF